MTAPELTCVVLSVGNPPELLAAVQSLLDQQQPIEIVVVNSGGGDASHALARWSEIRVIEFPHRLLPGAARNAGIAATAAPYVAFLASDCIAEGGWVRARLDAHRQGAAAVASAVTNPFRRNVVAWTSYVSLFSRRMPGVPGENALLYGVSYDRRLFDRFGLFREDMRGGEDTEFHQRLTSEVAIRWAPGVRTAHRHSRSVGALLVDHYRRGRRTAAAWQRLNGPGALRVVKNVLQRAPSSARTAWRAALPGQRGWIAAAALLIALPTIAYAIGSLMHAIAPVDEGDD
jgi:glycosyltransferase involved in cell wall biosynthesis